ncbi:MAG: hypothetical protein E7447_01305 [Ruminococcaceae bacterium]|nr:hypothetical protein [Oscillospiraceae bacterium]
MEIILSVLIGGLAIVALFWSKIFYNRDTSEVRLPRSLRRDAKIIDISSEKVGLKGDYKFKTCITFDDGFKYYSYDTEREDHLLYYTISLSKHTTEAVIVRAKRSHECACDAAGIPNQFVCGNCGHQGPYAGNCPMCGSNLKRYTN